MNRRHFLFTGAGAGALALLPSIAGYQKLESGNEDLLTVGIIGHTGRGNYGHGLDVVWTGIPEVRLAGVADPDSEGRSSAAARLGLSADDCFEDYATMLETVRPAIVAVCPRHPDQHAAMCLAAIGSGARGIYVEKPFCRTPAEADSILGRARESGTCIAVAHRNRYHPVIHAIRDWMDSGRLGKVLELRGRGKGDHRGGGEDLWVLGSHVLNLLHFLAGPPVSCSADILVSGHSATAADIRQGNEGLGLLLGDEIHARFQHQSGLFSTFDSITSDRTANHGFGLTIIGSEATVRIYCDRDPVAFIRRGNPFRANDTAEKWEPVTLKEISSEHGATAKSFPQDFIEHLHSHQVPALDLIDAIRNGREPLCDGEQGRMTVEMILAVFQSHIRNGARINFPLRERESCLEKWEW